MWLISWLDWSRWCVTATRCVRKHLSPSPWIPRPLFFPPLLTREFSSFVFVDVQPGPVFLGDETQTPPLITLIVYLISLTGAISAVIFLCIQSACLHTEHLLHSQLQTYYIFFYFFSRSSSRKHLLLSMQQVFPSRGSALSDWTGITFTFYNTFYTI